MKYRHFKHILILTSLEVFFLTLTVLYANQLTYEAAGAEFQVLSFYKKNLCTVLYIKVEKLPQLYKIA